jgi:hypothetical protein
MGASLPSAGDSYFCSDQVEEAKFAFGAEELLLYLQHEKVRPMIETAAFGLLQPKMKRLNLTLHSLAKPRIPA